MIKQWVMNFRFVYWVIGIFGFAACNEPPMPEPRPRAFPKIVFPEEAYQVFSRETCPFEFEYPQHAEIVQDSRFFDDVEGHDCWFDIYSPALGSRIHCSYIPVEDAGHFATLHNDAFDLTYKHAIKARSIEERPFRNVHGVSGFTFLLDGPVASTYMFYLTDSTDHFLRGSVYFDTQVRPDSMAPVAAFVRQEAEHMLRTFRWSGATQHAH
jgi:gliding motility-associated lipoprotein GldD